jgi:hypothetical protein
VNRTYTVVIAPDAETADTITALGPEYSYSMPPQPPLASTDGRFAWTAWNWPVGMLAEIELMAGCEVFPYTQDWKAEHDWIDKEPE